MQSLQQTYPDTSSRVTFAISWFYILMLGLAGNGINRGSTTTMFNSHTLVEM